MNAFPDRKSFGFSLVELLMGIVVVAILVALGMPSFQVVLRNAEVRTAADSITNGLQRARGEAVARNTNVQFVLGTGSSWTVDYVIKPVATDPPIDSRLSSEGSTDVTVTAVAQDLATAATTVAFNNFGLVVPNAASLAQVDLTAVGASQTMRVMIGPGGNAKMCEPNLLAGSSPRACS